MKQIARCIFLLLGAAFLCGCATPGYMSDRMNDAADIVTLSCSVGAGAKARVGPVHAGVIATAGYMGLRGGEWSGSGEESVEFEALVLPTEEGFAFEQFEPADLACRRGKGFTASSAVPFLTTSLAAPETQPLPRLERAHPDYGYFTQLEVSIGAVWVGRLGFNPGELLDFVLGWTTLDIFDDDLTRREARRARLQEDVRRKWRESNKSVDHYVSPAADGE